MPGNVFATIVEGLDEIAAASQDMWLNGVAGERLTFARVARRERAAAVELEPRLAPVPPGIGIVAPFDLALDRELWRWTPEPVSLYLTRTPHLDVPVSVGMAEALGDARRARAGRAARSSIADPGVTAYLCTSASFVGGLERRGDGCARRWSAAARAARITTSGAMLEALAALGVSGGSPSPRPTTPR